MEYEQLSISHGSRQTTYPPELGQTSQFQIHKLLFLKLDNFLCYTNDYSMGKGLEESRRNDVIQVWPTHDGTNTETIGDSAGLRKQLDKKNCGS